jgi:hypothetical protein
MILRRFFAVSALCLAMSAPVLAAEAGPKSATSPQEVLRALAHCAAVADETSRLACYDALAPQVKAALEAGPSVARRAPTVEEQKSWFGFDMGDLFGTSPKAQTTPEQFGAENTPAVRVERKAQEAKQIDSISAKVSEYAYNPFGKFIVFLENGQVWKQIQGDSDHARFRRKAADNTVTISRGFLGSYNLSINGSSRIYKVTRIK